MNAMEKVLQEVGYYMYTHMIEQMYVHQGGLGLRGTWENFS